MKLFRILFPCLFICTALFAQKKNEAYQYHIRQTQPTDRTPHIKIDGVMDEQAWLEAETATDFFMALPMDTSFAKLRTDVKMTYDQQNFYIIAVCYYPRRPDSSWANRPFVQSLRRDWEFQKNDNFIFFLDPFDDQTNGFTFGANAVGAQWDGLLYDGGRANLSWDNKWYSVVKQYEDRYVFEAAIPFKSIRYKKGITRWGINFSRNDLLTTEKSSWAPVPRQFPTASLAYTGSIIWDQAPPQVGPNISVIPYVLGGLSRDYQSEKPTAFRGDAGVDAKVAVTSSLNLDLTVNPDFSQVDVDQQVTNLDRFELFFPERRQFFLENGDQISNFGYANIRPFFSRRIGLGVPIRFGARLSGKLNKDWRIGLMDMQTGKVDETGLPAQNFAVMALQRRVFSRSNIGVILINKESLNYEPELGKPTYSKYNRNFGLEYNLASSNNVWTGKVLLLKSFDPQNSNRSLVHAANLLYTTRKWIIGWQHEYVGQNYSAEVGYVPRRGYVKFNPTASYLILPKGGSVLSHGPQLSSVHIYDESFRKTDSETMALYTTTFRSKSVFSVWASQSYIRLLAPFDPTNTGRDTLARGTEHRWKTIGADYISKPQSLFTYSFSARYGGYYADGTRLNLATSLGYRFQPYVSLAMSANYNEIRLPEPLSTAKFWLVGPRIDLTMTNSLFFTTFVQYNEQAKNVNLNTRLQWRYAPVSDLFIVYTDNYLPGSLSVKNRALVLKLTYWWNV
ncbi:carbohydrate binding protein with CBM9 domain [Larkinella arboricola]|uniref:Carbohydrate binding protein with CBM9 domain n=1 Tax=Larkinella arboricola TaxID=643671 RepID=A0A327X1A3_LARAB|nr:carbohydrate binding family 9 domain-containing protein [Larkinella arboricola]RAK00261.1 carbohydrate binding protein with CBM9 domain [Larkinella arboricola]